MLAIPRSTETRISTSSSSSRDTCRATNGAITTMATTETTDSMDTRAKTTELGGVRKAWKIHRNGQRPSIFDGRFLVGQSLSVQYPDPEYFVDCDEYTNAEIKCSRRFR